MLLEIFINTLSNFFLFALHIDSKNIFPKPLSKKEEEECFKKMAEGDDKSRNKLIEHNLRLVAHIIKKYYANIKEQDELISIGTIGLIKAVSTFDYLKGNRFATYASRCIEKATVSLRLLWLQKKQNESPFLKYGKYIVKSAKISMFSIVSKKVRCCTRLYIYILSVFLITDTYQKHKYFCMIIQIPKSLLLYRTS